MARTLKAGAVVSFLRYDVTKLLYGNPVFRFRQDESSRFRSRRPTASATPISAPTIAARFLRSGRLGPDDNSRVTINAGVRWDYESDMLNNDYVTPDSVRAATAPFVNASQYLTDGSDRPPFYGAWQPRVGLSYDLTGSGRHVLFGGYGRYLDRTIYNAGLDERFRLQWGVRTFEFSLDGAPRNGQETIIWNPSYKSRAGLDGLVASGVAPNPECI